MTVKCFAEGGKIVECKNGKCSSCGHEIPFRHEIEEQRKEQRRKLRRR